jgi:uncharacterized membrane protein YdjX (TVP38/TMEM64 family)
MAGPKATNRGRLKFILLLAVILSLVLLFRFTNAGAYLNQEFWQQKLAVWGAWAYLAYIVIYIVGAAVAFPGSVLTIAGALVFGTLKATLLTVVGATAGASGAFWIARFMGREFVEARVKGKLAQLDERIEQNGFMAVLILRLVPIFPFNFINYGCGLTRLRFSDYLIASFIGMLPGTFAYCYAANAAVKIRLSDPSSFLKSDVLIPFGLFLILIVVVPWVYNRYSRRAAQHRT